MKASIKKYYRVQELGIYNVITTVIKEFWEDFTSTDLVHLCLVNKDFSKMIPNTIRLLKINFLPLQKRRPDYEQQDKISSHRVYMASAAMIHFGLDPGKLVQWMGGEYTGARRNVQQTLDAVRNHVHTSDYLHMQRILMASHCQTKQQ